jgi:eukaryotic-like serine/threonine-protein kinase
MPEIGQSVSHYRILDKLGAGGMGEVYRAQDTNLNRQVAIKALPDLFSGDPERLARFEREAQLLASLNHPNIAMIFGMERVERELLLVMELVEGPTLAELLEKGPLPVEEALEIGRRIAEGLEAAHEKGIIHRDLKPANIKITPEGNVKILDFGLAKALTGEAEATSATQSPTITEAMTRPGVILGTAAYMSPEQARGATVDKRADIWAFGVVLFEMLTGQTCFTGDTIPDILAAVVRAEPDWTKLPDGTPPRVRDMLRKCLAKDRKQRLRDIGDARLELEAALAPGASITAGIQAALPQVRRTGASRFERSAWALLLIILVAATFFITRWAAREPAATVWKGSLLGGPAIAITPKLSPKDGTLAFQALEDGQFQIAIMTKDGDNWRVLTKDRDKGWIFQHSWAWDGNHIYYDRFTDGPRGIYKVSVMGGEERPVWPNAMSPEALPDGSLLGLHVIAGKNQVFQFWPDTGKTIEFPVEVSILGASRLRAFPDGLKAAVIGAMIGDGPQEKTHLLLLDLVTRSVRRLETGLPQGEENLKSLTISSDGAHILAVNAEGAYLYIIEVAINGSRPPRTIMGSTQRVSGLDMDGDGNLFVDQYEEPVDLLRVSPEQNTANWITQFPYAPTQNGSLLCLPGERVVLPLPGTKGVRLMLIDGRGERIPLAGASEWASLPVTRAGPGQIACLIGPEPSPTIALITTDTQMITRRIPFDKGHITSLASSPDGRTLYCAADNMVWKIPISGGEPGPMRAGKFISVDPLGQYMIVQTVEANKSSLIRVPLNGGQEREIPLDGPYGLESLAGIGPQSIRNGRMLVSLTSSDQYHNAAGMIDLATGHVTRWKIDYAGAIIQLAWTEDGKITAFAVGLKSSLWKFQPQTSKK